MDHQDGSTATSSAIPADIRARVIEAANRLFDEAGGTRFPAVADVRRLAKTDMNATSSVMREWKRQQSAKPEPVSVAVPEPVQQAGMEQLAVVWSAAQDLANASLKAAQASWAIERDEMESMRHELAQLYEAQARELEEAQAALALAVRSKEESERRAAELAETLNAQIGRADQAEARAEEIQHRAADLKSELERAHEETKNVRQELTEARLSHRAETEQLKAVSAQQIEQARAELATFQGKAEAIQAAQIKKIEDADDQAATLRTELDTLRGELATVRAKAEAAEQLHRDQKKASAEEALRQAERFTRVQDQRDTNAREAAQAREQSANLAGQVEILTVQCRELTLQLGAAPARP